MGEKSELDVFAEAFGQGGQAFGAPEVPDGGGFPAQGSAPQDGPSSSVDDPGAEAQGTPAEDAPGTDQKQGGQDNPAGGGDSASKAPDEASAVAPDQSQAKGADAPGTKDDAPGAQAERQGAPESGTDSGGDTGSEAPAEDSANDATAPEPDWKQKYSSYRSSMERRLELARSESERLRQELEALKKGGGSARQGESSADVTPLALTDDEKKDVEDFCAWARRTGREGWADLIMENSPDGAFLRDLARDYDPPVVGSSAASILLQRTVQTSEATAQKRREEERHLHHAQRIVDRAGLTFAEVKTDPVRGVTLMPIAGHEDEFDGFFGGVQTWLDGLPYREAGARMTALERGSAEEVCAVLNEYRQTVAQAESPPTPPHHRHKDPAADEAAEVATPAPRRSGGGGLSPGSRPQARKDSVATFKEAFG
ncbi:hypothetical protein JCM16814_34040 [Desulfobaculum senezii]